jgi:propionyl-CoA carboxylase alpha chain
LRYRGADYRVFCRTPRQAELARLMPQKKAADTSKMLLCPMPGLVVAIHVKAGDVVQEGQSLAIVEAMKMENILRAERRATVSKVNAGAGDSLSVDDVIMEFE